MYYHILKTKIAIERRIALSWQATKFSQNQMNNLLNDAVVEKKKKKDSLSKLN